MNETGLPTGRTTLTIISRKNWLILTGLLLLMTAVGVWAVKGTIMTQLTVKGVTTTPGSAQDIHQPDSGILTDLSVREGSYVYEGEPLARIYVRSSDKMDSLPDLETMKMNSKVIASPLEGYVSFISDNLWKEISVSDSIMTICSDNKKGVSHVLALVHPEWLSKITRETTALINIDAAGTELHGGIPARVVSVGETPMTKRNIDMKTGMDDDLIDSLLTENTMYGVLLEMDLTDDGKLVYRDGSQKNNHLKINSECTVTFILDESHPYKKLFAQPE